MIEFQGTLTNTGVSQGHYVCDVQNKDSWYRTNDERYPEEITAEEVSKKGCAYLFQRTMII